MQTEHLGHRFGQVSKSRRQTLPCSSVVITASAWFQITSWPTQCGIRFLLAPVGEPWHGYCRNWDAIPRIAQVRIFQSSSLVSPDPVSPLCL